MAEGQTGRGVKRKCATNEDDGPYCDPQIPVCSRSFDQTSTNLGDLIYHDVRSSPAIVSPGLVLPKQFIDEPIISCTSKNPDTEISSPNFIGRTLFSQKDRHPDTCVTDQSKAKSVTHAKTEEICFGSICNINAQFFRGPPTIANDTKGSDCPRQSNRMYSLEVLLGPENCVICSPLVDEIVGFINLRDTRALGKLFEIAGTRMEIPLLASEWNDLAQAKFLDPPKGCIEIAIFGNRDDALLVGDWLSSQNLFLQDPTLIALTATYQNPHKFPFLDLLGEDLSSEASEDEKNIPALSISQPSRKVSKHNLQYVLDHIDVHDLQPVEPDGHLTVSLFPHQKEAVDFMIRRETGQMTSSISLFKTHNDQRGRVLYSHVITGQPIAQPLSGPFGGILADTMGLGKTISTLSTVVSTLDHAKEWAKKSIDHERSQKRRTKATLVILPNEALMDQWLDEISKKFEPGTFSPCRYHGGSRRSRVSSFKDFEIILTTYGIVKVEFCNKESLIFQHHFFRIVLDEAHCIKGRSTRTHEATCNISAARRWCLTGSPIQNSLDDLGALVTFLRVPLLEEKKLFRSHIINTAYSGSDDCFENLRLLLGFICLRRNTSVGMLVQPTITILKLDLATDERKAYENILDFHDRAMDLHVSGKGPAKGSCTAFQALLELRIFCNNGLYKDKDPTNPTDPFDVEEYFNFLRESKKTRCTNCDNEVLFLMESELPDTAVFTQYLHLICGPCYKSTTVCSSSNSKQSKYLASEYSQLQDQNALVPLEPSVWNELSSIGQGIFHPSDGVFSTKFRVLLSIICSHVSREKGIVFSAWTKSLKIVAMMLRKEKIGFVQVDGSMSNAQRQQAFESFKFSDTVNILLITIGAGAVGLNLSIATRVHILEPSWNPMVEKQAIGRVVRLDQRNPVVITRYIMRGTVEENVLTRQDFKMRVAMDGFKPSLSETSYDQRHSDSDK